MRQEWDIDSSRTFFFAEAGAQYYDVIEELIQPFMGLIHDTMASLVEYALGDAGKKPPGGNVTVLDVGSGSGAEALRVLARFPEAQIVSVDFSESMNAEFKKKLDSAFPGAIESGQVKLLESDFFSPACEPQTLCGHLGNPETGYDAVLCGFMLHHYPYDAKREAYQRMHDVLRDGGTLVHGDLFSFGSERLARWAHAFGEQWIQGSFSAVSDDVRSAMAGVGHRPEDVLAQWIDHWNNTHVLDALENILPNVRPETSQSSPLSCRAALSAAGFRESGCPFRLWDAGVLWAWR